MKGVERADGQTGGEKKGVVRRPSPAAIEAFRRALQEHHVAVSVRASRGLDRDAALRSAPQAFGTIRRLKLAVMSVAAQHFSSAEVDGEVQNLFV